MGYHSSNFKSRWGYGFVVLAALLWASGGTASKFLFNNGLSPFQLVQLRVTICGVVLFAVLAVRPAAVGVDVDLHLQSAVGGGALEVGDGEGDRGPGL